MTGGICSRRVLGKRSPKHSTRWETLRDFEWKKKKAVEATVREG